MEYNRHTRIRANRQRKAQSIFLFLIVSTLVLYTAHLDYQDEQLERSVLAYR